jgi:hypothetical protein
MGRRRTRQAACEADAAGSVRMAYSPAALSVPLSLPTSIGSRSKREIRASALR